MLMHQETTHVDAAVQTTPRLHEVEGNSDQKICTDKGYLSRTPSRRVEKRRHTIHETSGINRALGLTLWPNEGLTRDKRCQGDDVSLSLPPSTPLSRFIAQTPKRHPDFGVTRPFESVPRKQAPLSPTGSPTSSESDSIEIIDHRSSFNSPDNFRSRIVDVEACSPLATVDFGSEDEIKVDDEGWIRWRSSSPQPIPALHGPLSLPYARGAEGTVMSDIIAPSQVVWGLEEEEEEEVLQKSKSNQRSENNVETFNKYPAPENVALRSVVATKEIDTGLKRIHRITYPELVNSTPGHPASAPRVAVYSPGPHYYQPMTASLHTYISPISPTSELMSRFISPAQNTNFPHAGSCFGYSASPSNLIGSPFAPRSMQSSLSPEVSPAILSSVLAMAGKNTSQPRAYLPTPPHSTSPLWAPAFSPGPARITNPSPVSPSELATNHSRSISAVLDNANRYLSPRPNVSPDRRRGDVILPHLRSSGALATDAATNKVPLTPPTPQSPRPITSMMPNSVVGLRKSSSMEFRYIGQTLNTSGLRHARSLQLRRTAGRDLTPVPEEEGNDKDVRGCSENTSVVLQTRLSDGNKSPMQARRPRVRVKLPTKSKISLIDAQLVLD